MTGFSVDSALCGFWPPVCMLCGVGLKSFPDAVASGFASDQGSRLQGLCGNCAADMPWLNGCRGCGLPVVTAAKAHGPAESNGVFNVLQPASPRPLCAECSVKPLLSDCVAACAYQYPASSLVQALKFNGRRAAAAVLGSLLGAAVLRGQHEPPDWIVPVPLSAWRLFRRGFNQSAEIAACLPASLRDRVNAELCRRVRSTPMQSGLPLKDRAANVRCVFGLTRLGVKHIPGKRVAVVDDVMTSGATMSELSKVLYRAGAAHVQAWVVTRTLS